MQNKKKPDLNELLKWEIAQELGLGDKVRNEGWSSLTTRESGKIGGILASRLRNERYRK